MSYTNVRRVCSYIKSRIIESYYKIVDPISIRRAPLHHKRALEKLCGKRKIKCAFFVLTESGWKYDYVFKKMLESDRFEPIILICPRPGWGADYMRKKMCSAENYYKKVLNYPTIMAFNEMTGEYVDVRKSIHPDIIFYCTPYRSAIDKRYFITKFPDILTVYVPYTFNNSSDYKSFHDELLHNLVWRYYAETEEHKQYSVNNARNKGLNVVVTGYPGIEGYLDGSYKPSMKDWKIQDDKHKRIIWAPHHTIANTGTVIFSCFLRYCDFMVKMARKYEEKVQFIFKPHPLLRPKLENYWGKEKTDIYFSSWEQMPNTMYSEGNYVDMFYTSDAMIHDSGSFIAEYLYLNKPVMRTMNDYPVEEMYNGFTQRCIENHYMAYSEDDIEAFIVSVINGNDPMKPKRTEFIKHELIPNGFPSDNILHDILESIDNQILYRN